MFWSRHKCQCAQKPSIGAARVLCGCLCMYNKRVKGGRSQLSFGSLLPPVGRHLACVWPTSSELKQNVFEIFRSQISYRSQELIWTELCWPEPLILAPFICSHQALFFLQWLCHPEGRACQDGPPAWRTVSITDVGLCSSSQVPAHKAQSVSCKIVQESLQTLKREGPNPVKAAASSSPATRQVTPIGSATEMEPWKDLSDISMDTFATVSPAHPTSQHQHFQSQAPKGAKQPASNAETNWRSCFVPA